MPDNTEKPPLRIKAVSKVLARVNTAGTQVLTATVRATIKNPSRRLSCMFSLTFEADDNQVPNSYTSAAWTARAIRRNRITGKSGQLHTLVSSQALPNAYELDSAIREILITAALAIPATSAPATLPGNWVLLVEWEPNQPAMCQDEIENLFGDCDVSVNGTEPTLAP
jgi:hypothetical protein